MKKITLLITIILALVMVLGSSVIVYAQEPAPVPDPEVKIDGGTAYQGDYAYLYVRPANWKDIVGVEIFVYYDETVFEVSNVYEQCGFNGANTTINYSTPGEVSVRAVSTGPIAESGSTLFYIPLHVKTDAVAGKYPITLAVGEAYGADLSAKTIKAYSSYVTVNEKPPIKNTLYSYANVDKSIAQGEIATINYQVGNGYGFASGDFTVDYDESKLHLEEVVISDTMRGTPEASAVISVNDTVPGFIKIAYTSLVGITSAYPLFSLKFTAINNEAGSTSVYINANNLCDTKFNPIGANEQVVEVKTLYKEPVITNAKITLDSYDGYDGDVVVDLTAEEATKIAAGDFELTYDKAYLTCVGVERVDTNSMLTLNPKHDNGLIKFSYINENGINVDTVLARVKFKTVKIGTSLVGVVGKSLVDKDFNALNVDYVDATIKTQHELVDVPRLEPTCTEKGHEAYKKCAHCDYTTDIVEIPAKGHSYEAVVTPPTCTEKGYTTHTCSVCGDSYVDSYVEASGHQYVAVVTPPTCLEQGYTTHTCSVCGDSYVDNYVDAKGHSFGEWQVTTPPTCTETGIETRYCADCDATETRVAPANGHSYVDEVIAPTCLEKGYTKHTCSVCGKAYNDTYVEALGHNHVAVVTPPTCTEQGYTTHTCSRCGDSYVDSYIEAKGHTFGEWTITTAPTCTATGIETRYCQNCDALETRVVPANGHTYVDKVTPPTCTKQGYTTHTCSVCGHVVVDTYVDALNHDYVAVVTPPTCTEQGYTTHTCSRCSDSYIDSYVDAKGHSFGEWQLTKEPTCTETGIETRYCQDCDVTETRVVKAKGHSYVDEVVAPTCIDKGYTKHTCSVCGNVVIDTYVEALGHKYEAIVTPPTCTKQGYTTHTCSVCGDSYVDTYVPVVPHAFGEWQLTKAPTCTETGIETRYCEDCDATETRVVPANGHTYVDVVTPPTCTDKGYTTHTCSVCGKVVVDTYVEASGHKYEAVVTPPTHSERGYTTYTCSECGHSYVSDYVDIKPHTFGDWHITKAPTCIEEGIEERVCTDTSCNYKETRVVEALGHDYVAVVTLPTCTKQGYTTHTCSRCGDSYVDSYVPVVPHTFGEWQLTKKPTCTATGVETRYCQYCDATETRVVPANGHSYVDVVTPPTCLSKGYTTHTCSVCGNKVVDTYVDALGHDYVDVVTPPTCTEQGYTTHTCSRCGDSYVDTYVPVIPHDFGEWTITTAPTCTATGIETRYCQDCDATETRVVPANGHSYVDVVTPPTCLEKGYTTHTCSVCGNKIIDTYVDALGHDYISVVTPPTCLEKGYTTHTCSRCGDSYIDSYVEAKGHSFGEWQVTTPPTCTVTGIETRYCHDCDATETRVVPANGHSYVDEVIAPTCIDKGYTKHTCSVCGDSYNDTYMDALGHSYSKWIVVTAPNCTSKGKEERTCLVCGEKEYRDIPALGHSYVDTVILPTCTEQGYTIHTCSICHSSYVDSYVNASGHYYGDWTILEEATCTHIGKKTHKCLICGMDETVQIPKKEHTYVKTVVEPTCTHKGYTQYTCTECGHSYTEDEVPQLEHVYVDTVVSPTCTDKGYTEHKCSVCGHIEKDNFIDATGHTFGEWEIVKEPTENEDGLKVRVCHCGERQEEIIPKLGKSTNKALAIGLGVGIPLTTIAIITPIIVVVIKRRKLR